MYNSVTLIGRLGKDPERRTFQDGSPVVTFSLATTESWKKDGERQEKTQWHNVTITNKALCDIAEQYLKKGSQCMVVGQVEYRSWEKDGETKYMTEIALRPFKGELRLLDGKAKDDAPAKQQSFDDDFDSQIPF